MSTRGGSVRIVGGSARGRRIVVPVAGTRPTSARAREALFNRLDTLLEVSGSRVLDLYAGSGAVGLEALSRGAIHARFVDSDRRTAGLIVRNAAALDLPPASFVVDARTVERFAATDVATDHATDVATDHATDVDTDHAKDAATDVATDGRDVGAYRIVFADPPYAMATDSVNAILTVLTGPGWLAAGGVAVLERSARTDGPAWPEWVEPLGSRRYGEGALWYGRAVG